MDNTDYFKYSQINDDNILDFSKPEGILVINQHEKEQKTSLMVANHNLIKLITTYKTLKKNHIANQKYVNKIIDEIIFIIENTNLINYSAFCIYFQVVGYSFNSYKEDKNIMCQNEKRELFRQLLDLYIDNRHNMYLYHGYSDQVLQIISDFSSNKRKGKIGIEKIEIFLKKLKFIRAKTIIDFDNNKMLLSFTR